MNSTVCKAAQRLSSLALLILVSAVPYGDAMAFFDGCDDQAELAYAFSSGASWQLCAVASEQHGLEVSSVHYRAPGDTSRSVLSEAHAAQILMHYHDETDPRAQLGPNSQQRPQGRLLPMTPRNCDGSIVGTPDGEQALCSHVQNVGILAKFGDKAALQREQWTITSALQRDSLVWAISITFSEDGLITPAITLSGRGLSVNDTAEQSAETLAAATILATWRLVFDLDDGDYDKVEQFDFILSEQLGNKRPMSVTPMSMETFASVNREQFTGWRVVDPTGSGFYLDPSNSGFDYVGGQYNWANFDIALSRFEPCERYALSNLETDSTSNCGASLDNFVNAQSLEGAHPVLWFSQSRSFHPSAEHWPVISNVHQSFTLVPFDWTNQSPFEQAQ